MLMAIQQSSVLIEAVAGTPTVRSVRIPPGGSVTIGRLPECDLADPGDAHLSRQHCRIDYRAPDCILHNLSSNGTLVNGQPADGVRLRDGDRIECSHLVLQVTFTREEPPTQRVASAEVPTRRQPAGAYAVEDCRSGLVRYTGQQEHPDPVQMLELISGSRPAYAIVDFRKAGLSAPEQVPASSYLFHWISEEVIRELSPAVLAASDVEHFPQLVRQGWGKDGIICLFSSADRAQLVKHLRDATGYDPDNAAGGMLGYCWPAVLDQLLQHQQPDAARKLLQGIDAVLLETAEAPGRWRLYADASFEEVLRTAGMVRVEEAAAESRK